MACNLIEGSQLDCRDSVGGIKEVYITEFANKATLTATSGTITAHTLNSGKRYFTFQLEKENAEFTEVEQNSVENGTLFYEQTLTFTMKKMSAKNRNIIRLLAQNRLLILYKDNNDVIWLMGQENGADKMGTNEAKSGKAMGDMNGYTLTFVAKEPQPANVLTSSLLTTLQNTAA